MTSKTLPSDIVAVELNDVGYMFYVNDRNQLSYLRSVRGEDEEDFEFEVVLVKDGNDLPVPVPSHTKQVAAVGWIANGLREIRLYYVDAHTGRISELCLTHDVNNTVGEKWRLGDLWKKALAQHILPGSPISATLARNDKDQVNGIRVYASPVGQDTQHGMPAIIVLKYYFHKKKWLNADPINADIPFF